MRIAMVSEHASPLSALGGVDAGGQNVHVASLAAALAELGVDVDVYTRRDDSSLPGSVAMAPGVDVHHVDAGPARFVPKDDLVPYLPPLTAGLARAWVERPPDVVHAHFWMSGVCALDAAPKNVSVLQTFHALGCVKRRHQREADTSPPGRIAAERRIARDADHIIATCSDEAFELRRLGAEGPRISIVPCGVDLNTFGPDGPAEDRRPGMHRIVCVSRLVERKGIDDVVRALPSLSSCELVIAGGGSADSLEDDPVAVHLRSLAASIGVADRVELRGPADRASVARLMRSADVVCCTPWYEPFGIVPLEAMACGKPVIASAVGGLVDSVVDGVTGLHVPPRRPDRIAEAIAKIVAHPSFQRRMGQAGIDRTRTRYGWPRIAAATLEVYAAASEHSLRSEAYA
jgi:glycosyltransferase involved in cell wall biosynthesis